MHLVREEQKQSKTKLANLEIEVNEHKICQEKLLGKIVQANRYIQ